MYKRAFHDDLLRHSWCRVARHSLKTFIACADLVHSARFAGFEPGVAMCGAQPDGIQFAGSLFIHAMSFSLESCAVDDSKR